MSRMDHCPVKEAPRLLTNTDIHLCVTGIKSQLWPQSLPGFLVQDSAVEWTGRHSEHQQGTGAPTHMVGGEEARPVLSRVRAMQPRC